jgi:FSR family fosmidomycin resistance protein-like MFS transporter
VKAPSPTAWAALGSWSAAHLAVDAVCAFVLFSALGGGSVAASWALVLVVLYDALAFALQPLLGLALDELGVRPSTAAAAGGLVTVASVGVLVAGAAPAAVVIAAVGNAVFHVGGGVVSLTLEPGKARAAGCFVAPGAVGLLLGTRLAGRADAGAGLAAALVAVCLAGVLFASHQEREAGIAPTPWAPQTGEASLLLLLVIAARSYVGMALALPWRSQPMLLVALTVAIAGGKVLGGLAADALGRLPVAATALALAAPLLLFASSSPPAGIASMLLLNMTMPVTLVALAEGIPGRPGFAFGLSCLALVVGALPPLVSPLAGATPWSAAALVLVALAAAVSALRASPPRLAPRPSVVRPSLIEGEDA